MEKYFFISEYFLPLLIIKYNFMKIFTITEEQVKEAYNAACNEWKAKIKDWFPEAFEKQLEVGKVYKYPSLGEKFMFKFNGFGANNYGFSTIGEWHNDLGVWENEVHLYKEATKEEWLEALKEEAKRRGFKKGVKYNYVNNPYFIKRFKDELYLGYSVDLADDGDIILEDGVWARVIKEEIPTQKEIDRVLYYLKNKNNS